MAELRDVVAYLCLHYPHRNDLSKARLTKLVYLADWKSAIDCAQQITNTKWMFNHYGPYVSDILDLARSEKFFDVEMTENYYGHPKEVVRIIDESYTPELSAAEKAILDHVIATTATKNWNTFIQLVYSTYPILTQPRMSQLDLVKLAEDYRDLRDTITNG